MSNDLYIPLLLLNLTKQENQLLILLYVIHETTKKAGSKKSYMLEEIAKLASLTKPQTVDALNKLLLRNIIGKTVYDGIVDPKIVQNFDDDFLNILYDKINPLESAKQKAGFIIDDVDNIYVLNPVIRSWKYTPKTNVVRILKKLKKSIPNDFIEYLLKSFNDGKKDDKRKQGNARLNGWNIKEAVEIFRAKYQVRFGNVYLINNSSRDYIYMKQLIGDLSINSVSRDNLEPFFDYAFDRAMDKDYLLKIVGLKYYLNEYLTKLGKKNYVTKNK